MTRRTEPDGGDRGSTPHDEPNLDDVMDTAEPVTPHHRDHAKAARRPDEDELDRKTSIERAEVDRQQPD